MNVYFILEVHIEGRSVRRHHHRVIANSIPPQIVVVGGAMVSLHVPRSTMFILQIHSYTVTTVDKRFLDYQSIPPHHERARGRCRAATGWIQTEI